MGKILILEEGEIGIKNKHIKMYRKRKSKTKTVVDRKTSPNQTKELLINSLGEIKNKMNDEENTLPIYS